MTKLTGETIGGRDELGSFPHKVDIPRPRQPKERAGSCISACSAVVLLDF